MEEFKKISSNEWGAPYEGASGDALSSIAQRDNGTGKAILAHGESGLAVSLDDASEDEENGELAEAATVGAKARANRR